VQCSVAGTVKNDRPQQYNMGAAILANSNAVLLYMPVEMISAFSTIRQSCVRVNMKGDERLEGGGVGLGLLQRTD